MADIGYENISKRNEDVRISENNYGSFKRFNKNSDTQKLKYMMEDFKASARWNKSIISTLIGKLRKSSFYENFLNKSGNYKRLHQEG